MPFAIRQAAMVRARQVSAVYFGVALRRSKRVDTIAVLVEALDCRLHLPDDSVLTDVLFNIIPCVGIPSESSSSYLLADDTYVEKLPQHPPNPAENIKVHPTSSAADANVSRTPEAAREGVTGDKKLL